MPGDSTKDTARRRTPVDFYEIQRRQKAKSLAVFALLTAVYIFLFGALFALGWIVVGTLSGRTPFAKPGAWAEFLIFDAFFAVLIAALQYFDARKNGGAFILKRLGAQPPDRTDRYHVRFENAVEEIRLAAGLPKVKAYVLPDWTVNSLSVIEPDGTPAVAATEGMLAEFTDDELEAATAHETAHIAGGDAFLMTLVCAMSNFFERVRNMLEPDVEEPPGFSRTRFEAGGSGLAAFAALSSALVRTLGILVNREREILADATAVELGRSPAALARAIYKADVRNSFVGDFNRTYAPLFIVPPRPRHERERDPDRTIGTHPPVALRIGRLAEMAHTTPRGIVDQVRDIGRERERAKLVVPAAEEVLGPAPDADASSRIAAGAGIGLCPRCGIPLSDARYEGVPIKICGRCMGKLVHQSVMERILTRTEISFSPALARKAEEFRDGIQRNPLKLDIRRDRVSARPPCPSCGYRLAARPYNYQYFIPVERCLSCDAVWFDADNLEILQILVERAKAR